MKKYFLLVLFGLAASAPIIFLSCRLESNDRQVVSPVTYEPIVLIIDAGHGGEDGGAVTDSGARESVINLSIAQKVDMVMGFCGVPTIMLRSSDISLHSASAETIREKKVSDLHNRVEKINATKNAVLISIHQNSFPDPQYRGAHVFYAKTEGSKRFAEQTQELLKLIDTNNERIAAEIYDSVYLMNHINCPAILVECGFLSNAEEALLLQDADYQTGLATILAVSYLQFQHSIKG